MNRPLAAVPILAMVAIVALFVWGFIKTSPEPPRIPAAIPAVTPIDANQDAQHVIIDNLPTVVPEPTRGVWQTPTSAVPSCPGKDGALCQIPAPVLIAPTISVPSCNAETIATMTPGELCRWEDVTPTVTQQEEPFR